ncbi:C-reactive protein-like [Hypanus sabinus]|uniref:C-reactive protein-like n=1 Tax=Hypanus sabinus TaxID=79690 RepID=UPI0028C50545|nr:C-reactive protein-like [Hypanus sabinus]
MEGDEPQRPDTLCLKYNTEQQTKHTLISYKSTVPQDLVLSRKDEGTMKVIDKEQQLVGLNISGEQSSLKLQEGTRPVTAGSRVIVGQQEESIGKEQNFVGEILDSNLWDWVLSPIDIRNFSMGDFSIQGNVISWLNAGIETKGKVMTRL